MFTTKDLNNLKIIYHLVKERGYTLEGAKKKLKEKENNKVSTTTMTKEVNTKDNGNTETVMPLQINKGRLFGKRIT